MYNNDARKVRKQQQQKFKPPHFSFLPFFVLLLLFIMLTQHSGNLVAVMALLTAQPSCTFSNVDP